MNFRGLRVAICMNIPYLNESGGAYMSAKSSFFLLVLFSMFFILAACGNMISAMLENPVEDERMLQVVAAIENSDIDRLRSLFLVEVAESENFDAGIEQILYYFTESMIYWETVSRNTTSVRSNEGTQTTVTSVYRITTDDGTYRITQVSRVLPSGESGLLVFNLRVDDFANLQPVGRLSDWQDFNSFHWIILLLNVFTYAMIVVTLIHCIKNKLRRKFLLILLIFLQGGFAIANLPLVFSVRGMINIFSRSVLLQHVNGFELVILLPSGAIIYWIIYKKFKKETVTESIDVPNSEQQSDLSQDEHYRS